MTNSNDSTQPQNGNNPLDDWDMDDWQSAGWPGEIPEPSGNSFPAADPGNNGNLNSGEEDARPELTGRITDIQPGIPAISGEAAASSSGTTPLPGTAFPTGQKLAEGYPSPYSSGVSGAASSQTENFSSPDFRSQPAGDGTSFP